MTFKSDGSVSIKYFVYIPSFLFSIPSRFDLPPTNRFPLLFSPRRLRMSPVVPIRTVAARSGSQTSIFTGVVLRASLPIPALEHTQRGGWTGSEIEPASRIRGIYGELGSLLPFNILASPLAAAARGIDMRPGGFRPRFSTAPLGSARLETDAVLSHASFTSGRLFSSGGVIQRIRERPISIWGSIRARFRSVYSAIDPCVAAIEPRPNSLSLSISSLLLSLPAYGSESVTFRPRSEKMDLRDGTSLQMVRSLYRIR